MTCTSTTAVLALHYQNETLHPDGRIRVGLAAGDPVRERVIGGAAAPANQRVKLFGFLQRSSGAAPDDFRRAWGAAPWAAGDSAGVLRYAQNDTLPTPMGSPLVDGIDEFWFDDEADARIFHLRWEAWVSEELVRPGLVPEARHFVLLAHEDVIHAGPR